MSDADVDMLERDELLELACESASDPAAISDQLHGGGSFSWDWPIDPDNASKGVVRIFLKVNDNKIARERNGVIWIRPHEAIILQQFNDGSSGESHPFTFRPDTPLGIDPDGKPRPTLANLIRRHILSAAA